jgi:Uncharacterized membrane protein (homolog of Drosophila rhomboid)
LIPLRNDNPIHIVPVVTFGFIAICVTTFLWQSSLGSAGNNAAMYGLGVIPAVLLNKATLSPHLVRVPAELTLVTSMFLHSGWMHLTFNMLFLWIFGRSVEDSMGHVRFVVFYLLCGITAALGQAFLSSSLRIPMVGASGAISSVLGAYLLLYPYSRVLVALPFGFFVEFVRLPALWVLGFWFFMQLINFIFSNADEGGVAWFAHMGGFLVGMLLIPFFKHRDVPLLHPPHGSKKWHREIHRK